MLLAHDLLAYDDLRAGRLVIPIPLALPAARAWHFVCPRSGRNRPQVEAFRQWMKEELAAVDWRTIDSLARVRHAPKRERPARATAARHSAKMSNKASQKRMQKRMRS